MRKRQRKKNFYKQLGKIGIITYKASRLYIRRLLLEKPLKPYDFPN